MAGLSPALGPYLEPAQNKMTLQSNYLTFNPLINTSPLEVVRGFPS